MSCIPSSKVVCLSQGARCFIQIHHTVMWGMSVTVTYLDAPPASSQAPSAEKASVVKHCPEAALPAALRSPSLRPPAMSLLPSIVPCHQPRAASLEFHKCTSTWLASRLD